MRRHRLTADKQQGESRHNADEKPACHAGSRQTKQQLARPQWRHQQINNIALYLGYHQRRGCIGKGVLQNIHHDQAGHQKYDKINAISKIATVPNGHRKYQQKQHRSDHWCGQCLQRNIHKSLNFTAVEGDHPDQIDTPNRDRPNTVRIRVRRRRASV